MSFLTTPMFTKTRRGSCSDPTAIREEEKKQKDKENLFVENCAEFEFSGYTNKTTDFSGHNSIRRSLSMEIVKNLRKSAECLVNIGDSFNKTISSAGLSSLPGNTAKTKAAPPPTEVEKKTQSLLNPEQKVANSVMKSMMDSMNYQQINRTNLPPHEPPKHLTIPSVQVSTVD